MYESADILEAARFIRPHLHELVGDPDAEVIDQQLADLLEQANTLYPIENQILELLAARDATRIWVAEFLKKQQPELLRTYNPLPGQVSIVNAAKFVCPYGDYIWYRPRVGIEPPLCPTHMVPLKPEQS